MALCSGVFRNWCNHIKNTGGVCHIPFSIQYFKSLKVKYLELKLSNLIINVVQVAGKQISCAASNCKLYKKLISYQLNE